MEQDKQAILLRIRQLFLFTLLIFTVFRLFYSTVVPMTPDETYHWEWSRHLAWGYYDHPPLVAGLIAFFVHLGGNTIFWTRLTAVLCILGTTYLTYRLGREMGGVVIGVTAGFFSLTSTAMMLLSILVTTDSPLIFFWQLTIFLVWRAIRTAKGNYWYLAGVSLGLGFMSKLLIVPLIVGIFLFLLLSAEDRFWLRRKEPYLAFGLALLIFSPFIIWNSQHGWTSFVFQFTRHDLNIDFKRPFLEYLPLEAGLVSPVLFFGMLWSLYQIIKRIIRSNDPGEPGKKRIALFILMSGWLFPLFLGFDAIRNSVSAHWPMAAYGMTWIGLAFELSYLKGKQKKHFPRLFGKWRSFTLTVILIFTALISTVIVVAITWNPDWLSNINANGHSVNEAYGWVEVGREVSKLHRQYPGAIATNSYGLSSMISFYTPDHLYIGLLGHGTKHGRAYDIWDDWRSLTGQNVLYVSSDDPSVWQENLQKSCQSFKILPPLQIRHKNKVVRQFNFGIGYHILGDPFLEVKKSYTRKSFWDFFQK